MVEDVSILEDIVSSLTKEVTRHVLTDSKDIDLIVVLKDLQTCNRIIANRNIPISTPDNPEDITKKELMEHVLDDTEKFVPLDDYKTFVNETDRVVTELSHGFDNSISIIDRKANGALVTADSLKKELSVINKQLKSYIGDVDKIVCENRNMITALQNEKYTTCDECTELDREDIYSRMDKLEAKQFRDNQIDEAPPITIEDVKKTIQLDDNTGIKTITPSAVLLKTENIVVIMVDNILNKTYLVDIISGCWDNESLAAFRERCDEHLKKFSEDGRFKNAGTIKYCICKY